ncbi:hypothetical protein AAG596_15720 [Citromicrobium bathyomarinum]|uniref:hypothetical protein n=1 Tax=Citromicrobium bathyomarinum TaxID=72174 RepID=UPI00315A6B87
MTAPVTIRDLMTDPALFGDQFGGESYAAWRVLLGGFYGLSLSDDELETFKALTGRSEAPQGAFSELWEAIGRRGGKTQAAALLSVYHAPFMDYRSRLAPGEVATVLLLAADKSQARSAMRYVRGLCEHPMIRPMVKRETETSIEFTNRTCIEIATASFRSVRGYTLAAVICDEIAYWFTEGANPDAETIAALKPGLATLGGPLIALSSPYAKRGTLWNAFKRHFGGDSTRILVAQAPTLTMNPTLDPAIVEAAMQEDPERAQAEYGAQFRGDISTFLDIELIERASRSKPLHLPPSSREEYHAFVDPNGGGSDEFSLSIAHREGELTVVDGVWAKAKISPATVVQEFAAILRSYRVAKVRGDRYAGRWPADEFRKHGVEYVTSDRDRSALYLEFMARINSGAVILPPDTRMQRQFANLERRAHRGGRDTIDHPPGSHDDRANAVAGAVAHAMMRKSSSRTLPINI